MFVRNSHGAPTTPSPPVTDQTSGHPLASETFRFFPVSMVYDRLRPSGCVILACV